MKLIIFQPPYPAGDSTFTADQCIQWMCNQLDNLKAEEQDLILLPEYANVPAISDQESMQAYVSDKGTSFMEFVANSARRLNSLIAIGTVSNCSGRWFNRTLLFDRMGEIAAFYDKLHLTTAELEMGLTPGTSSVVAEQDGLRLGFATCFDFYFPAYFEDLAARKPDIILIPSYQRSESRTRIRILSQARALDSGAWLARSAYAMSDPQKGGCSLLVTPAGEILADAAAAAGIIAVEFDPHARFVKPASHGKPVIEHRTLLEKHRRPDAYRYRRDRSLKLETETFPAICAHRGVSKACPENTLPAFAAALASGAQELEFDLWLSADGVPVVCHDQTLDRTTGGSGKINEMAWSDIRKLDVSTNWLPSTGFSDEGAAADLSTLWRGVGIPRLEEVLELIDGRMILNIHIKDAGPDDMLVKKVCDLLRRKSLLESAYIAGSYAPVLQAARNYAPEVTRACLMEQRKGASHQVDLALEYGCKRIQMAGAVDEAGVRKAHEHGIICNYFWSDDLQKSLDLIQKGVDVILTNCAHTMIADLQNCHPSPEQLDPTPENHDRAT